MNKIFSRNFTVQERVDDTFKVLKEKLTQQRFRNERARKVFPHGGGASGGEGPS